MFLSADGNRNDPNNKNCTNDCSKTTVGVRGKNLVVEFISSWKNVCVDFEYRTENLNNNKICSCSFKLYIAITSMKVLS